LHFGRHENSRLKVVHRAAWKPVLVTGGAGFIGSHTCKALAAAGFLPVAFDDLSKGHAEFVRWGPLVHGDILDTAALDHIRVATRCQTCAGEEF
jgi:UDP-glucose 4-epimerase